MVFKMSVNPELAAERKRGSFNPGEISKALYGDNIERRKEIADFVESVPELNDPKPPVFMSRAERYENMSRKTAAATKYAEEFSLGGYDELSYFDSLVNAGEAPPVGLHYTMFLPTVQSQMTEEQQDKWLDKAVNRAIIGTYAQTELGHGTNVRFLETTATYDPSTEEFIINTPTITATKWWPGNLGKSSNYAIVIAQLIIKGKKYGTHGFIVNIRDETTHKTMPGIKLGDIGPKYGIASNDNGFMQFNNIRIPRENMLMKNSKVLPDGTYVAPKNTKLGYGAMVFVRSIMLCQQARDLAKAVTVAIRYSCVRRQGEIAPGKGEVKLLDYQNQQYRLFPNLAKAYAFYFAGLNIRDIYFHISEQISAGQIDRLPELHALTSGLKSFISWDVAQGIEQSRLSCGGHGYMHASGLPELYGTSVGGCTYEGDNIVLFLQVARFLIKCGREVRNGKKTLPGDAQYIARQDLGKKSDLNQSLKKEHLLLAFEHVARRMIMECVDSLDQERSKGVPDHEAWYNCSVQLCKAARAHVRVYLVKCFMETLNKITDPAAHTVMEQLCDLFILNTISQKSGHFLLDGYLNAQQLSSVRQRIRELLSALRPNAVNLVDAFMFRDRELRSVLGRYDGWVYENLLEWVKHSEFNKQDVMDCHHKYMGPMMKAAKSKL